MLVNHNSGFFSNCSVSLHDAIQYIKQTNKIPNINFSQTFTWYRDTPTDDVYNSCFKFNPNIQIDIQKNKKINMNRGSRFDYKKEMILELQPYIDRWYRPNDIVLNIEKEFKSKYNIDFDKTLAICYRGGDKITEIKSPDFAKFSEHVLDILKNNNLNRVFIQTDQEQYKNYFYSNFSDVDAFHLEEMPTTTGIEHVVRPGKNILNTNKLLHAQQFLAVTQLISKCKYLINHSGNVARWLILYRGNTNNTIQYYENRKL